MSPNLAAFLRVIRAGESSQDNDAYRMMFGGELFDDFSDHPRKKITRGTLTSTAAGAYQFLASTWDECKSVLGLPDFSPDSQDKAAVFLIKRRGALDDVEAGRIEQAIAKCAKEWASLPGSPYGQPTRTLAQALATYKQFGGTLASEYMPAGETPQEAPMAPFIAAVLPSIIDAVPKLINTFGSGSEVSKRNEKAAEVVVNVAKEALNATNEQEVAQKLATDPQAPAIVRKAIEDNWFSIQEAGGGGIEGARKADAAYASMPWHSFMHSPSFWWTVLMVPPVYSVIGSVVGLWGTSWPADVRSAIATAIVSLVVGGGAGYYWGQTTSRNRTKD